MNISELQEKLTKLNVNISNREISAIWGMDESSFSRKKREGSEIKHKNIQQLEEALKINIIDKPEIQKGSFADMHKQLDNIREQLGLPPIGTENVITIPYRPDVYLSAGYGIEIYEESAQFVTLDLRLFTTDRGNKINPAHCEIVRISGNSMYPEYRDGDRVIIDRDDTEFIDGHIFAFRYNGQCFVKEINVLKDRVKCISLNKEYEPFYIEKDEEFTVFGRILPRIRL